MSIATSTVIDARLDSKSVSFQEIPIVDVGSLIDGSDPQKVADEIGYICENIGFLYIRNHGVDAQLIKDVYAQTAAFFDLPLAEKICDRLEKYGPTGEVAGLVATGMLMVASAPIAILSIKPD